MVGGLGYGLTVVVHSLSYLPSAFSGRCRSIRRRGGVARISPNCTLVVTIDGHLCIDEVRAIEIRYNTNRPSKQWVIDRKLSRLRSDAESCVTTF